MTARPEPSRSLCAHGVARVPRYHPAQATARASRRIDLRRRGVLVAEGIFAPEIVPEPAALRGLLADAICLRHHRAGDVLAAAYP